MKKMKFLKKCCNIIYGGIKMNKTIVIINSLQKDENKNLKGFYKVEFKIMVKNTIDYLVKSNIEEIALIYKDDIIKDELENSNVKLIKNNDIEGIKEYLSKNKESKIVMLDENSIFLKQDSINKLKEEDIEENEIIKTKFSSNEQDEDYIDFINKYKDKEETTMIMLKSKTLLDEINNNNIDYKKIEKTNDLVDQLSKNIDKKIIYIDDVNIVVDNCFEELEINKIINKKTINSHIKNGVHIYNESGIIIESSVKIEKGVQILPGTILKGNTTIKENSKVGPNSLIEDSIIYENSQINASQVYKSIIKNEVKIGPFCHIRPNSIIERKVKIGDFVEIKNSTLGAGTSVSHLTYVGDSDVGKNVNFGCGVVTVNYDGVNKNRCKIEDGAFIGCNTNLIAPVKVEKNGYTAAGSTITKDVLEDDLAIARARQKNIEGFSKKKLKGRKLKVND